MTGWGWVRNDSTVDCYHPNGGLHSKTLTPSKGGELEGFCGSENSHGGSKPPPYRDSGSFVGAIHESPAGEHSSPLQD